MIANSAYPIRWVAILEDFIAIRESGGDYDAYLGHAHPPTGTIIGLSFQAVYDFQRRMVSGGAFSSAVGRYQFVQRTLNSVVTAENFPLGKFFDAPTQDECAAYLIDVTRGGKLWRQGAISDQQFAHNLSCEWASLPDPFNGGASHYDGDGVNHAGQTLDAVYATLSLARTA